MAKTIESEWLMRFFSGMDNDEYLPVEYVLEVIKHAPDATKNGTEESYR